MHRAGSGAVGASRALVLNATFEPLGVVSTRRALLLVLGRKAELLQSTGRSFRSERLELPEPSVVRLAVYVAVPRERTVAVNRRTVFARDGHRCQYCGGPAESIDHVVPRSRGGSHSWDNVVACCRRCNSRKEDRLPQEAGLELRRPPVAPRHRVWILALAGQRADWAPYLAEQQPA
jgi:5-methylcytosine-specific restriction endonuclease McrA